MGALLKPIITVTSQWTSYRLKSPAIPLIVQPFVQAHVKNTLKLRICRGVHPMGKKGIVKTSWWPVFKTGLQDVYEDLKTLTDPSFWRRILKVPKTSILDVLQPKFNAPFKTSIQVVLNTTTKRWYDCWKIACNTSSQISLKDILKTSREDVYEDLKTLTDPSSWRRALKLSRPVI